MRALLFTGFIGLAPIACAALAGCAKIQGTPAPQAGVEAALVTTCQAYTSALLTASALSSAGKLTAAQVQAIKATEAPVNAICLAPLPSDTEGDLETVQDGLAVLQTNTGKD